MEMNNKKNIFFGIVFFILFSIIGFYPLMSKESIRIWPVILAFVFLLITLIRPNLFTPLNKAWIKLGVLIGKVMSPLIMGIIFFFIVTPIGLFTRLLKIDSMGLKKNNNSYWINRQKNISSMKKQF
tara:strand:- start:1218 stop:1595 length:378 start_codon:yes stop_codon:yes gene_type:complete